LYTNIDQTLVNSLHTLLNYEIGGLNCNVTTPEYRTCVHCLHTYHLFCNALVHVIYFCQLSGQCSNTLSCKEIYMLLHTICVNKLYKLSLVSILRRSI